MSNPPILTQLYWPEAYRRSHGYLVGWSIRGLICTVIAVLDEPLARLEERLATVEPRPELLGIATGPGDGGNEEAAERKTLADLWFTVETGEETVKLMELSCCGYRYRITAQVIYYDSSCLQTSYSLIWPLRLRLKSIAKTSIYTQEKTDLELVCDSINRTPLALSQLLRALDRDTPLPTPSKTSLLTTFIEEGILLLSALLDIINFVYRWKVPVVQLGISDLPFHSYFGSHLQVRMKEMEIWKENRRTRELVRTCPALAKKHMASYLLGRSVQWKVVADFVIGVLVLVVLLSYRQATLEIVHVLGASIHIEVLKSEVKWLMGLPAGFKPNVELDSALGSSILTFIDYWNHITTFLTGFEPEIVRILGIIGTIGASFQLVLLSDFVSFCSIHVYYIYRLVSAIFFLQVDVMFSLFRLTMGYKKNVLKQRVDRAEFGIDEVLLGTLIFTGLLFLCPTIAMYYLSFVGIWMGVELVHIVLRFVHVLICQFPYYLLSVYIIGGLNFPSGVYFTLLKPPEKLLIPTQYLQMKTQKYPLGLLFADWSEHLGKLLRPLPVMFLNVLRGKGQVG